MSKDKLILFGDTDNAAEAHPQAKDAVKSGEVNINEALNLLD